MTDIGAFARELGHELGSMAVAGIALTVLMLGLFGLGFGLQAIAASQGIHSQAIPGAVLIGGLLVILVGIMVRNAWKRASEKK